MTEGTDGNTLSVAPPVCAVELRTLSDAWTFVCRNDASPDDTTDKCHKQG